MAGPAHTHTHTRTHTHTYIHTHTRTHAQTQQQQQHNKRYCWRVRLCVPVRVHLCLCVTVQVNLCKRSLEPINVWSLFLFRSFVYLLESCPSPLKLILLSFEEQQINKAHAKTTREAQTESIPLLINRVSLHNQSVHTTWCRDKI